LTVTPYSENSPNNLAVASTLTATSSNAVLKQNGSSVAVNVNRVFSFYLKRKTGSGQVSLQVGSVSTNANLTNSWQRFTCFGNDLSGTYSVTSGNYTVTTASAHGLQTGESIRFQVTSGSGVTNYISSVTVVSTTQITFSSGSATSSGNCSVFPSTGRLVISTNGDEVYAWGASLDVYSGIGGAFAYSYVPTTTSIVTKPRDSYFVNPTENGLLTSTSGTWYSEFYSYSLNRFSNGYLSMGTDTYANTIQLNVGIGNAFRIYKVIDSFASLLYTDFTPGWKYVIVRWDGSTLDLFVNGTKISGGSYTNTTFSRFESLVDGSPPFPVRCLSLFPEQLSDSKCIQLTTP
jgi:hypothetical protein